MEWVIVTSGNALESIFNYIEKLYTTQISRRAYRIIDHAKLKQQIVSVSWFRRNKETTMPLEKRIIRFIACSFQKVEVTYRENLCYI